MTHCKYFWKSTFFLHQKLYEKIYKTGNGWRSQILILLWKIDISAGTSVIVFQPKLRLVNFYLRLLWCKITKHLKLLQRIYKILLKILHVSKLLLWNPSTELKFANIYLCLLLLSDHCVELFWKFTKPVTVWALELIKESVIYLVILLL